MQTRFKIYTLGLSNCPAGMTAENCPLRKKLAEMNAMFHIEYKTMEDGSLLFPDIVRDTENSVCIDMHKTKHQICNRCRNSAQRTRG